MKLGCMLERLFSNRTAYRQLQHAAQSGLQDGISNESAGLKDLDTNQFVLVVEFDSDVRSDLNAACFFLARRTSVVLLSTDSCCVAASYKSDHVSSNCLPILQGMGYRKKQKRGPEKKSLLESLNPDEAAIVLRRLVAAHPELETEGEAMTKTLLREDSFEQIAEDVYDSVQVLGHDQLNGRAGRHEWGYVEPGDAASDILSETIAPFLDDLKRRVDLGLEVEALEICKGLVLGFYRLDHEGGGELLQWAPEFTVETAAYALEICRDGTRLEQSPPHRGGRRKRSVLPENFVEQFVPDWAGMIERLLSKRR